MPHSMMNKRKVAYFIGGSWDGVRKDINIAERFIRVAIMDQIPMSTLAYCDESQQITVEYENYRLATTHNLPNYEAFLYVLV